MITEVMNVYFYALYDEGDQQAHSGLTGNICAAAVKHDIAANYYKPRYVTVRRVPELVAVCNDSTHTVSIMQRSEAPKVGQVISCETCGFYAKCTREPIDGLACCDEWRPKE